MSLERIVSGGGARQAIGRVSPAGSTGRRSPQSFQLGLALRGTGFGVRHDPELAAQVVELRCGMTSASPQLGPLPADDLKVREWAFRLR